MKRNAKLNVMIALLAVLSLLAGFALADERLYTSESFRIPLDRVAFDEPVPEETETEEAVLPEDGTPDAEPSQEAEPAVSEGEPSQEETTEPEEGTVLPEDTELTEGTEQEQEPEEAEILPAEERKVYITSSRGEHVTQGEPIYLEAHLEGFGDLPVTYRWQVDKNDGEGWQDTGSNRDYHVFMASAETVQYNWRLIVEVDE